MSLQQKFTQSNKGDGLFRIDENPVKYSDKAFQDSLNANNPKKSNGKAKTVPTSQLAAGDKASSSIPGK